MFKYYRFQATFKSNNQVSGKNYLIKITDDGAAIYSSAPNIIIDSSSKDWAYRVPLAIGQSVAGVINDVVKSDAENFARTAKIFSERVIAIDAAMEFMTAAKFAGEECTFEISLK